MHFPFDGLRGLSRMFDQHGLAPCKTLYSLLTLVADTRPSCGILRY